MPGQAILLIAEHFQTSQPLRTDATLLDESRKNFAKETSNRALFFVTSLHSKDLLGGIALVFGMPLALLEISR